MSRRADPEVNKKISASMVGNSNACKRNIRQYKEDGTFVAEYKSSYEAQRITGLNQSNIIKACKGDQNTCGGFIWKYAE